MFLQSGNETVGLVRRARRPTEYVEDDQERHAQSVRNTRRERRCDVDREVGRVLGQTARGKLYQVQDRRRGAAPATNLALVS